MLVRRMARVAALLALSSLLAPDALSAQSAPDPATIHGLRWRMIGPFRASRTKAAAGVASQPNVYYMGAVGGGVWKTEDYGRIWTPIFDDQPSGSIGAIDVAASDPNVVYVGSGEGLQRPDLSTGDGIYKSTDAGKSWTHLGLRDGQQIPRIAVDPTNPERLFVAVLGHPYGPNAERGIYRSTNGGQSFEKVLGKDDNTGGADVVMAPTNPNLLYASLWEARQGPWENGAFTGPGSGLYKSTDGGTTWTHLTSGLPGAKEGLSRIGIAISPSNPDRVYLTVQSSESPGIYRTDDGGASWTRTTSDARIYGRGDDFAAPAVDPKNPDIVYSANVVAWKSTDAGKSWVAHRGAPGGDDYQRYWINPNNPDVMLLVADQGAIVTVNGGKTWSSWYNQPTAAFYHVTADNAWPYRLCGGQQDSGSGCVASRGDDGSIGYREFHPVGVEEYGYVAPDPLDPNIVYGGKVTRFDRRTGQTQEVGPNVGRGRGAAAASYRTVRTQPILFSPTNPHKLYFASNVLWQTVDGGLHWTQISPDLARADWAVPANVGKFIGTPEAKPSKRGVIYTIAPSPVDSNTIWVGTDDGLIHVTRNNGRSWANVTPPQVGPWAKISLMDASHFDANVAYAAVSTFRLDDLRPHLYRTRDGGKSWTEIVKGIANGAITDVVREDPKRRGLLYAGTETQVWFSLDDGDAWQSLRLNMPATSIRDLIIKDDDIAVATHGRGFWILDDATALRQWNASVASQPAALFQPQVATRVRYSMYTDTPVPPDEPMAENPPDGAVIDYWLARDAAGPVTLEILDESGALVRRYASDDRFPPLADEGNAPWYWFRPLSPLPKTAGLQRYVWDLHYPPPPAESYTLPISATPHNTMREPRGPFVAPGRYVVRLTVDGKRYTQPLTVRMDPRVKTPAAALRQQSALSMALYRAMVHGGAQLTRIKSLRTQLAARKSGASAQTASAIDALDRKLQALEGPRGRGGPGAASGGESYGALQPQLLSVIGVLQGADGVPTSQAVAAAGERQRSAAALTVSFDALVRTDLPALNATLAAAGIAPITNSTER